MSGNQSRRRVGIVGYGHLGKYLVQRLQADGPRHGLELAFVWNRDANKLEGTVPAELQLGKLTDFLERCVDIIIEVAHPCIAQTHGESFLKAADFMVGSPTALADSKTEQKLREVAQRSGHTLYIPSGALWGGQDIQRMDEGGLLQALTVTMVKHPNSFRLGGHLGELAQRALQGRMVLYDGPVRGLCPLAPNNVNTMAAACLAAPSLGFDGVKGCLIADPDLPDYHMVEVEATGPGGFSAHTRRKNPAACGAVTGAATFAAFWSSLLGEHETPQLSFLTYAKATEAESISAESWPIHRKKTQRRYLPGLEKQLRVDDSFPRYLLSAFNPSPLEELTGTPPVYFLKR